MDVNLKYRHFLYPIITQKTANAEGEPEPFWKPIELNSVWRCHTRTNLELLVTGDRVKWQADPNTGLGLLPQFIHVHLYLHARIAITK